MKKRTAVLVFAMVLGLSVVGCGSSSEPKQETNAEVTQQTTNNDAGAEQNADTETTSDFAGAEDDNIVLYAESEIGEAQFVGQDTNTFESMNESIVATKDIPLFNGRGKEVGYLKNGGSVTVTESCTTTTWCRFVNPIAGADYDYMYINRNDFPSAEQEDAVAEANDTETEASDSVDPYENALAVLDEVIDTEKVYTSEEFAALLPELFDKINDITFNSELVADRTESNASVSLKGEEMKQYFADLFKYIYYGMGGVSEIGIKEVENGDIVLKENEIRIAIEYKY